MNLTVPAAMLLFALFLVPTPSFAGNLQIGVSPNRIDVGEIARGAEGHSSFSIITHSKDEFLVRLAALSAEQDIFRKPEYSGMEHFSSDEDASGWVVFPANPVVIKPVDDAVQTPGGSINGWRSAGFTIRVPSDAEPCYHIVHIKPSPYIGKAYDTGVNIIAVTMITVVFKVSGDCVREGTILDIQQGGVWGKNIEIDTYFKNTGTATISAKVGSMEIGGNGAEVSATGSNTAVVKPGEAVVLKAYLDSGALEPGTTYNVTSTVSYGADSVTKSNFLTLEYAKPPVPQAAALAGVGWKTYFSGINAILILVVLVVAYLIYKRE